MNTMLNPQGRIGPVTFRNAATILIAIGAILTLLPLALPALTALSLVSVVLIYPWVVIWVKRLHDAGKSGWMFVIVLVLYLIASFASSFSVVVSLAFVIAGNALLRSEPVPNAYDLQHAR
jgi:uncharacterized membrane protein YhaH (DUF805 family)